MIRRSLLDLWHLYRDARSFARRTKLSLVWFIAAAVADKLDYEMTPRCLTCGSQELLFGGGDFATGVVAPDGGREYRYEEYIECRLCGARESQRDFDNHWRARLA